MIYRWFNLFAKTGGKLTLYPSKVTIVYQEERSMFFSRNQESYEAYSNTIQINIKNFPKQNQPKSFNGAVGKYQIETIADETKVRLGEPILLNVKINGDGIIDNIKRPDLSNIPEYNDNFKISQESTPGEIIGNIISFKYTIRPSNQKINKIPKIPFTYFNINSETYETTYSKEIPLTVTYSKVITGDDVISGQNSDTSSDNGTKQGITTAKGILSNYNGYNALSNQKINLAHYLWICIFPIIYLILFIVIRNKKILNENIAVKRSKNARKNSEIYLHKAKNNINNDSFYENIAEGLMNYISDKFNLGKGELTVSEVYELFDKQNNVKKDKLNDIQDKLKEIFEICEMERFASTNMIDLKERKNTIDKTNDTINKIETVYKSIKR